MSGAIFISYRRDDSEGEAGRLYDDLTRVFDRPGAVFMDVSDIHPGKDFRQAIDENVARCTALLAIIGPAWTTIQDASGVRRIDQPNDFVRLEIASALKRGIDVIPVLVHGAHMPRPEELPGDLQNLAYRNGVELTHARWNSDVVELTRALREYVQSGDTFATRSIRMAVTGENLVPEATKDEAKHEEQPARRPMRGVALGLLVLVAATAGAADYVYIHHKLKHHEKKEKAAERAADDSAAAPLLPGQAGGGTSAAGVTPVSDRGPVKQPGAARSTAPNPLAGTWVASQWSSGARSSIPVGTPVEFEIAQKGDGFTVVMFANVGNALLSCGTQSLFLTNHGLSSTWDEPASPSCGKYPGMYTASVRLYMTGTRMHMIVSGKGMSTGMDFDRVQ